MDQGIGMMWGLVLVTVTESILLGEWFEHDTDTEFKMVSNSQDMEKEARTTVTLQDRALLVILESGSLASISAFSHQKNNFFFSICLFT